LSESRATGVSWAQVGDPAVAGAEIYTLIEELYPICRSISGDGVRRSFDVVERVVPIVRTEVPSGTQVLDWTVPREWNIREAWIDAPDGTRVVDFHDSCLHVLGYSTPIRKRLPLAELREHLFVHATDPTLIPFRTSYYNENWGFCLTRQTLDGLVEGEYEVCIDSTLADGAVTYAEAFLPGSSDEEILISTYSCHPSLANENRLPGHTREVPVGHAPPLLVSPALEPGLDRPDLVACPERGSAVARPRRSRRHVSR
jgi:aminopeptidase-like protein